MAKGDIDRSTELADLQASEIETAAPLIAALLRTPNESLAAFRGQLVGKLAEVDLSHLRLAREHLKAIYVAIKLDDPTWWQDMHVALQVLLRAEPTTGARPPEPPEPQVVASADEEPPRPMLQYAPKPPDEPEPAAAPQGLGGLGNLSQSAFLGGPPPALPFGDQEPPAALDAGEDGLTADSASSPPKQLGTEPPAAPATGEALPFVSVPTAPAVPAISTDGAAETGRTAGHEPDDPSRVD